HDALWLARRAGREENLGHVVRADVVESLGNRIRGSDLQQRAKIAGRQTGNRAFADDDVLVLDPQGLYRFRVEFALAGIDHPRSRELDDLLKLAEILAHERV